jgi:hypothetical protein
MGNHKMGRHHTRINSASPKVSKATIAQIQKQPVGTKVTKSPNVIITTARVETVVAPSMNVVRGVVLIRSITNLSNGSSGVSIGRNFELEFGTTNSNY